MATKMHDMKRPKKTKKQLKEENMIHSPDDDKYPYGLKIRLGKDEISKIPELKNINAGDIVNINAVGKVIEISVTDSDKGRDRHNVEIQIQKIGVANKDNFNESFKEASK